MTLMLVREGVYVGDGSWGGAPESRFWQEFSYPLGKPKGDAVYDGHCGDVCDWIGCLLLCLLLGQ